MRSRRPERFVPALASSLFHCFPASQKAEFFTRLLLIKSRLAQKRKGKNLSTPGPGIFIADNKRNLPALREGKPEENGRPARKRGAAACTKNRAKPGGKRLSTKCDLTLFKADFSRLLSSEKRFFLLQFSRNEYPFFQDHKSRRPKS